MASDLLKFYLKTFLCIFISFRFDDDEADVVVVEGMAMVVMGPNSATSPNSFL